MWSTTTIEGIYCLVSPFTAYTRCTHIIIPAPIPVPRVRWAIWQSPSGPTHTPSVEACARASPSCVSEQRRPPEQSSDSPSLPRTPNNKPPSQTQPPPFIHTCANATFAHARCIGVWLCVLQWHVKNTKQTCKIEGLYVTQMYKHTKQQLLVSTVSNGGGCIGTGTSSLPSLLTPETPPAPLSPFNPSTTTARCPLPGFGGGYLGTAGVKPLWYTGGGGSIWCRNTGNVSSGEIRVFEAVYIRPLIRKVVWVASRTRLLLLFRFWTNWGWIDGFDPAHEGLLDPVVGWWSHSWLGRGLNWGAPWGTRSFSGSEFRLSNSCYLIEKTPVSFCSSVRERNHSYYTSLHSIITISYRIQYVNTATSYAMLLVSV